MALQAGQRLGGAVGRHEDVVVVEGGDDIGADPDLGQRAATGGGQPDRREARVHGEGDPANAGAVRQRRGGGPRRRTGCRSCLVLANVISGASPRGSGGGSAANTQGAGRAAARGRRSDGRGRARPSCIPKCGPGFAGAVFAGNAVPLAQARFGPGSMHAKRLVRDAAILPSCPRDGEDRSSPAPACPTRSGRDLVDFRRRMRDRASSSGRGGQRRSGGVRARGRTAPARPPRRGR